MARAFALFALLFAVWLLWSGHTDPLLVSFGLVSAAVATYVARRLEVVDREGYPFHLSLRLLSFIPWVVWQIVKANVDVTRLILSPRLPIDPRLVRIKATQRSEIGRVIHANTITITPGTVSLDVRGDTILVHALTAEAASADSSGMIDRRVSRLEGDAE